MSFIPFHSVSGGSGGSSHRLFEQNKEDLFTRAANMANLAHEFSEKLFKVITNAVGAFLLVALFYILQYIFDLHFVCSCEAGLHLNGVLYLAAPPVILTWVVSVTESFHQKKISSSWPLFPNSCGNWRSLVMKYFGMSVVWITAVLFDGDWYFCLKTNFTANETGIPCKKDLTPEEQHKRDQYKTESLDWGFLVICGVLILWSIVESIRGCCRRDCCRRDCCKNWWCNMDLCCCSESCRFVCCPPTYQLVYEDLLAEEVNRHLRDELTKIASEKAKGICEPSIRTVRDHEQLFNQTSGDNADNAASEARTLGSISSSDSEDPQRPPCDTDINFSVN